MPENEQQSIEQFLVTRLPEKDFQKWVEHSSTPYKELMAYYRLHTNQHRLRLA